MHKKFRHILYSWSMDTFSTLRSNGKVTTSCLVTSTSSLRNCIWSTLWFSHKDRDLVWNSPVMMGNMTMGSCPTIKGSAVQWPSLTGSYNFVVDVFLCSFYVIWFEIYHSTWLLTSIHAGTYFLSPYRLEPTQALLDTSKSRGVRLIFGALICHGNCPVTWNYPYLLWKTLPK